MSLGVKFKEIINKYTMKKYFITAAILTLTPAVTFASWWNPTTWNTSAPAAVSTDQSSQISVLVAQITSLQQTIEEQKSEITSLNSKIALISATTSSATTTNGQKVIKVTKYLACPAPVSQSVISTAPTKPTPVQAIVPTASVLSAINPDYESYQSVLFADYLKNPYAYNNQNIVVAANIDSFIPFGSSGYNAGYLKLGNGSNAVMVQISNPNDYTQITNKDTGVSSGSLVLIYGMTASTSQQFQVPSTTGAPYTAYFPVINLNRIDRCPFSASCKKDSGQNIYLFSK